MSRKALLLVAPLVAGLALGLSLLGAGVWLAVADEEYQTSGKFYLGTNDTNDLSAYAGGAMLSRAELDHCGELARSTEVAAAVVDQLALDATPAGLRRRITVTLIPETLIFEVTARDSSAARAQTLANAWTREAATRLSAPASTCVDHPAIEVLATVTDPAPLPTERVSPDTAQTLLVAGAAGLLGGALLGGLAAVVLRRRQ